MVFPQGGSYVFQDAEGICSQLKRCQSEAEAYLENQEPENPEEEWEVESSPEEGAEGYQENQEQESPGQEEAYKITEEPKVIYKLCTVSDTEEPKVA